MAAEPASQERLAALEHGGPAPIDPTANVLSLVAAAMLRQDDLRKEVDKRHNALSRQERRHRIEVSTLEAKYRDAQMVAEARRLDALLASQTGAAALTATRAEATALALAERVDNSAKTLAASVELTAKAFQTAVDATAKAFSDRITPLEQSRYEAAGVRDQRSEGRAQNQWVIGLVLSLPSAVIALIALVVILTQN